MLEPRKKTRVFNGVQVRILFRLLAKANFRIVYGLSIMSGLLSHFDTNKQPLAQLQNWYRELTTRIHTEISTGDIELAAALIKHLFGEITEFEYELNKWLKRTPSFTAEEITTKAYMYAVRRVEQGQNL